MIPYFLTTVAAQASPMAGLLSDGYSLAYKVFYFIVALGILIFVHEFGHFIVARRLGVGVTKFSFGFGPKLVGITRGETEYLISAIPFGGYVKMVGESESDEVSPEEKARSFQHKPVWAKMAIVAAGPAGNLVFAVFALWLSFLGGIPTVAAKIGVAPESPAARAGLKNGDVVVSVDGKPVDAWDDLVARVRRAGVGRPLSVVARRGQDEIRTSVTPENLEGRNEFGEKAREPGIGITPAMPPVIGDVVAGSPAAKAGIRKGDEVLRIDREPIATWEELAVRIRKGSPGTALVLTVRRGTDVREIPVVPELKESGGDKAKEARIGIMGSQETILRKINPAEAFLRAGETTGRLIYLTGAVVVKLVTRVIPAKTLGGPILIAQMAGEQASQGVSPFAYFLGFLSVNLGVLNLLPIPILDGGHLLFFTIEGLWRKPLSPQARAWAQQVGLAIILMLTALVFYNDIARLFSGRG